MKNKKKKEAKSQFCVMLKPSEIKAVDVYAEKFNMTRSAFMGTLIKYGLTSVNKLTKEKFNYELPFPAVFYGSVKG